MFDSTVIWSPAKNLAEQLCKTTTIRDGRPRLPNLDRCIIFGQATGLRSLSRHHSSRPADDRKESQQMRNAQQVARLASSLCVDCCKYRGIGIHGCVYLPWSKKEILFLNLVAISQAVHHLNAFLSTCCTLPFLVHSKVAAHSIGSFKLTTSSFSVFLQSGTSLSFSLLLVFMSCGLFLCSWEDWMGL